MDSTRHEFFPDPGLAINQNGRIGRRHGFHLAQHFLQGSAFADDGIEVHLAADLVFQVELFLCQFVFEIGNLTVRQGILHGDRDLRCHLA